MKFFYLFLFLSISSIIHGQHNSKKSPWDNAYNSTTKQRFIPVELFTGATWNGKHELLLKKITSVACAKVIDKNRPCDKYYISGPFKTKENNTAIDWAGDTVSYYRRTFKIRGGLVESFFTINKTKDGLVRIYDKRAQWGTRTYKGTGSKFPLGYWKQGEVRKYNSGRPTRIEILELDGPGHSLTFRWTVGEGKYRNQDNIYTFHPERGFTQFRHVNDDASASKKKRQKKQ